MAKLLGRRRNKSSPWQDAVAPCRKAPFLRGGSNAYIFGAWAE